MAPSSLCPFGAPEISVKSAIQCSLAQQMKISACIDILFSFLEKRRTANIFESERRFIHLQVCCGFSVANQPVVPPYFCVIKRQIERSKELNNKYKFTNQLQKKCY